MTRDLAVACLQLGDLAGGPEERRVQVAALIEQAAPADLIVLPELWPVGYFGFDRYEAAAEPLDGPTLAAASAAARRAGAHVVVGSFVERSADGLHNTTALVGPDGELIAAYRKIHVFGYGSREVELIAGGDEPVVAACELGRIGLSICYDLRFPELYRAQVDLGAELLVVLAAWPRARTEHWRLLSRARAVENQAYVVACNGCGSADGTPLAGHSAIVDPWGEVVAEAGVEPTALTGTVELERLESCRSTFPALADRRLAPQPEAAR